MNRLKHIMTMIWEKVFKLLISLFWVSYLSKTLGPEQFGNYSYYFALITLMSMIPLFGMENVIINNVVNGKMKVITSAVTIRVIMSIIACLLLAIFSLLSGINDIGFFISISLVIYMSLVYEVAKNYYQSKEQTKKYVYWENLSLIASLLFKIALLNNDIINYPVFIASDFIFTFVFIFPAFIKHNFNDCFCIINWRDIKRVLIDAFPFFLSTVMVVVYTKIDQLMIKEMLGFKELGYYAAGLRISSAWWVIPTTLVLALYPSLIKNYKKNQDNRIAINYFSICLYSTLVMSTVIFLMSDFLVEVIFGSNFTQSAAIIKMHCFIGCLAALGVARAKWLALNNLQKWMPLYIFTGMFVNIIANYLLITPFGINGAVIATLIAQVTVLLVVPFIIRDTRETVILILKSINPIYFNSGIKIFLKENYEQKI